MSLLEARNAGVEMSLPDDCSSFGHQTAQQGQHEPQHLMSEALLFFPTNKNKQNLQNPHIMYPLHGATLASSLIQ